MWPYCNILFVFLFFPVIKTGSVCKILAQKLPVQLVEQFKESLAKKIALGRYQVVKQCFFIILCDHLLAEGCYGNSTNTLSSSFLT